MAASEGGTEILVRTIGELLADLIGHTNGEASGLAGAEALLHERVTLVRIDGTRVAGRSAVVDAVTRRGSEATLRVVEVQVDACHVAMEVPGLAGHFRLRLVGRAESGRLLEVTIEPG